MGGRSVWKWVGITVMAVSLPASADTIPPGWVADYGSSYVTLYDTSQASINMGFDFEFYGESDPGSQYGQTYPTDVAIIEANGYLGFGPNLSNYDDAPSWPWSTWRERYSRSAAVMWHDLNPSGSPAARTYYDTIGSAGSRVFVITWVDTPTDSAGEHTNTFQARLYETDNAMEFSYRDLDNITGSRVGLNYGDGVTHDSFWYDGDTNYDGGGHTANIDAPDGSLEGWTIRYAWNEGTDSYDASFQNVPEPATISLLLMGLAAGVGALRRRRST